MTNVNTNIRDYIEEEIVRATEAALNNIENKFGIIEFTTDEHGDFADAQSELIFAIFKAVKARKNASFSYELESCLTRLTTEEKIELHEMYVNYSEAYDTIHKMEEFNEHYANMHPLTIVQLTQTELFDYTDKYYIENEEHGLYSFTNANFGEIPFDDLSAYVNWLMTERPKTGFSAIDEIIKKWSV